jgi:hypothetical protein
VSAQVAYEKAIDEISASTAQKLANLKKLLAEVAAATARLAGGGINPYDPGGYDPSKLTDKELEDLKKRGGLFPPAGSVTGATPLIVTSKMGGTRDISGLSLAQQGSVLRSIELQKQTQELKDRIAARAESRSPGITVNQNFTATKVDAQDVAVATVNAVKFGAAVTIGATSADIVASRKQMYGEL